MKAVVLWLLMLRATHALPRESLASYLRDQSHREPTKASHGSLHAMHHSHNSTTDMVRRRLQQDQQQELASLEYEERLQLRYYQCRDGGEAYGAAWLASEC